MKYVVAILMPGAFQPLTPAFDTKCEAQVALDAIPPWSQRRKDLKKGIRQHYRTGMEAIVRVQEDGNVLEAV